MAKVIKPTIPWSTNGNALSVVGATADALRRAGLKNESRTFKEEMFAKMQSGNLSYDQVLFECFKHVDMSNNKQTTWDADSPYLPAGHYVVADPCYVLSEKDYEALLELINEENEANNGLFAIRGVNLAMFATKSGDGHYPGNHDVYPVDSGHIACIPIELADTIRNDGDNVTTPTTTCQIFSIAFPFNVKCDTEDGKHNIIFGPIECIETGDIKCPECDGNSEHCECEYCGGCTNYCDCSEDYE